MRADVPLTFRPNISGVSQCRAWTYTVEYGLPGNLILGFISLTVDVIMSIHIKCDYPGTCECATISAEY
ncbi:mRNA stability protein [Fusarium oxysporum f. sp. albedinis]|nr:mRNA stability protein [Fusarium oxysporum f. sp. albedinis]